MPWVSTPRRSASTRAWAIIVAFEGGTPLRSRRFWAKERAEDWETCRMGVWSCDVVVAIAERGMVKTDVWFEVCARDERKKM